MSRSGIYSSSEDKAQYSMKLKYLGFLDEEDDPFLSEELQSNNYSEKWSSSAVESWPHIEFENIYFFLIDRPGYTHQSLKSYTSLDAYKHFLNGFVHQLCIQHNESGRCIIKGSVNRCQNVSDEPYKAWVGINKGDGSIITGHCTCMNGLASICPHVVAITFQIEAATHLGHPEESVVSPASPAHYAEQIDEEAEDNDVGSQGEEDTVLANAVTSTEKIEENQPSTSAEKHQTTNICLDMSVINMAKKDRVHEVSGNHSYSRNEPKPTSAKRKRRKRSDPDLRPDESQKKNDDFTPQNSAPAQACQMEKQNSDSDGRLNLIGGNKKDSDPCKQERDFETNDVEGEKPFQCNECSQSFTCKASLETHNTMIHKQFTCDVCCKNLQTRSALLSHSRKHTGQRGFKCDDCDNNFDFDTYYEYLKHVINKHTVETLFTCDICSKSFKKRQYYRAHMKSHVTDRPFSCSVCDKSFRSNRDLQGHIKRHSGERSFLCSICGRTFKVRVDLQIHLRRHSTKKGEESFICSVCGKTFNEKSNVKRHMRIHTGEKPFKCNTCGACFNQSDTLQIHKRLHTGEKPFSCNVCGKRFSDKSTLYKHRKIHARRQALENRATPIDTEMNTVEPSSYVNIPVITDIVSMYQSNL